MIRRVYNALSASLRYKLLLLAVFPAMVFVPAIVSVAFIWSNDISYRQLLMKVNSDLSVAHEAFLQAQRDYLAQMAAMAQSHVLFDDLFGDGQSAHRQREVRQLLDGFRWRQGFDFVYIADPSGCDYWNPSRCDYKKSVLLDRSVEDGSATGVEIFSDRDLAAIDATLPDRVYLPLVPTPRAKPIDRQVEDRGMVLHSYYPIRDKSGAVKAFLVGGVLVNRDFAFVDSLRDMVYSQGSLAKDSLGTVTVFLEDVRINTNVPRELQKPGVRALGTRVSEEVRDRVLGRGERWIDRAFVVSEWYVSAYEPIVDVNGARVGMLYAGFLEAPFKDIYFTDLKRLLVLFGGVTAVCILLAVLIARSIFKPVEAMTKVVAHIRKGEDQRIGWRHDGDELVTLARQFDDMLDQLQEQRDQIQAAADELEQKVEDRTAQLRRRTLDLEENLRLLRRTREQLVGKEKLAAIGELTAGIAHEINNPTAVILGNMDFIIAELGEQLAPVQTEADLIIKQVYRIRSIINNLLQYSRPADYQAYDTAVDINQVVHDTLMLVRHDLDRKRINVGLDLRAARRISGNHQQFQQVLINLIINAVNASDEGGDLTLRSRDWKDQGALLVIRDTGCGIPADILPRIFDPFFTKTNGGTGLGLSVSYGILQRYDAEIEVRSRPGIGTCFYIWFQSSDRADTLSEKAPQTVSFDATTA